MRLNLYACLLKRLAVNELGKDSIKQREFTLTLEFSSTKQLVSRSDARTFGIRVKKKLANFLSSIGTFVLKIGLSRLTRFHNLSN